MFALAKYVVGIPKSSLKRQLHAVVVPTTMLHSDVKGIFIDDSITSAGVFSFDAECVYVAGNSVTLNKSSLPSDEQLVGQAIAHAMYPCQ